VSLSSRPDLIAGTRDNETRDTSRESRVSLYELASCHVPTGSVVSPALRSVRQETMFKTSKLRLTNCINDKSTTGSSSESKEEMLDQDDNDGELVMTSSNNNGDIVTVDTDTSDAESVYNSGSRVQSVYSPRVLENDVSRNGNNISKHVSDPHVSDNVSRGRKKSRMVAFPFLE